ncbi:ATP-binding protein [Nonomuraea sp. NPDC049269]|uniref:ATP-binding protein n=1 Tax=Nonomuraea sp. NPDC049269 TaxID=3364349 RepID=UPI003715501B
MKRPLHDSPRVAFTNAPHVIWRKEFPAVEISVPEARAWAGSVLSVGGPPSFLDDVLLLLSEVVTNAITHSDSRRVTVQITRTGTTVQVEVTDAGSSTTACRTRPDARRRRRPGAVVGGIARRGMGILP